MKFTRTRLGQVCSKATHELAFVAGDTETWRAVTGAEIVDSGHWFCLMGAMSELEMALDWSTLVEAAENPVTSCDSEDVGERRSGGSDLSCD